MHNLKFQTLQQYGMGKHDDGGQFYSICFYRIPQNCVVIAHVTCVNEKPWKKSEKKTLDFLLTDSVGSWLRVIRNVPGDQDLALAEDDVSSFPLWKWH